MQVDDQSVFRHKGERKVKTVEEDMEDVTSRAAELLEEGEELIGGNTLPHQLFNDGIDRVVTDGAVFLQVTTAVMKIRGRNLQKGPKRRRRRGR